jgi:hypothetical protein
MKLLSKYLSWFIKISVVLALALWLMDKNDMQTFWIFVVLWFLHYLQNSHHEALIAKLDSDKKQLEEQMLVLARIHDKLQNLENIALSSKGINL